MPIKLLFILAFILISQVSKPQDIATIFPKTGIRTVRDTFYVQVGMINNGEFFHDHRSQTAMGLFRKRGNQFYTDTLFSVISRNDPFRDALDSMGITYTINNNWVGFIDSVIKHTDKSKFVKKRLLEIDGSSYLVFWPVTVVMTINESYLLLTRILTPYEFKGEDLVYSAQRRICYKPILHYEIQPL
jgi:hypothetical protein